MAIIATICCYSSGNPIIFCGAMLLNGAVGATTAATAWSIRLHAATSMNIGVITGVTRALYKVHSLLFLPLVGTVAGTEGTLFGALLASFITVATLAVLRAYVWRRKFRRRATASGCVLSTRYG